MSTKKAEKVKHLTLSFIPVRRVATAIAACAVVLILLTIDAFAQPHLFGWVISEFQPNIQEGGRACTIAVHPTNNNIIFVTSETGGLFQSTDRGKHWQHVDSLPVYLTKAVAFVPSDPNVMIVTAAEEYKVANGGGIWRSTDGGANWVQLPSPPAPAGVTARFGAWEISIAPDTGTIFAATEYGVAISTNRGKDWTHVEPFTTYVKDDHRVFSVVAQSGNLVLAGGPSGVTRSLDGGGSWRSVAAGPGAIADMHAFGRSPYESTQVYAVNSATELYYTEDSGDHWTRIASAPVGSDLCGGIAFVKPVRNFIRLLDLYFGNRCRMAKLTSPAIAGTNRFDYRGTWTTIKSDHDDTRDLAFDSSRRPLLLATDGGLHQTGDGGLNWTLVGGGTGGYNALQITEVRGQWIDDIGRYDLYFGTQDNYLWSSGDFGASWTYGASSEGFFIEAQRRVATASDSKITFVTCADCVNKTSGALFSNVADWPNPLGPLAGNPVIVRKKFHVQGVNADAPSSFQKGLAVTYDFGDTWHQYATFPEDRRAIPKLSDPPRKGIRMPVPVLYQSIRTGFDYTRNIELNHLARIVKRRLTSGATVSYPAMNNFGGLGINKTMFAWYQVFAVDPSNSSHLLAPDIVNEKMMESWDGGNNWTEIPKLTSLVTDNGSLLFRSGMFPQASAISFSPEDPRMVAVGTMEGGILISSDRGATWEKVPGSERVTHITSFEWRTAQDLIVSSYGRGLWRLKWKFLIKPPDFYAEMCRPPCFFRSFDRRSLIDPPPERFEQGVVVYEGRIQGVRASGGVVKELFIWPGSSVAFVSGTNKSPAIKVTETTKRMGFIGVKGAPAIPERGSTIVGVALGRKGEMVGTVFSEKTLSAYAEEEVEKEEQEVVGSEKSPTVGKPYLELRVGGIDGANGVEPGAPVKLSGRDFAIGTVVVIAIDGRAVEKTVVGRDGIFSVQVQAPREFGLHSLIALDAVSGKVIDGTMVLVRHVDKGKGRERLKSYQ